MPQVQTSAAPGIGFMATPYASLPTASTETGSVFYCSDGPGGPALWLSDGTYWRPFARGIQRFIGTTNSSGQVVWTFGTPFTAKPCLNFMIENTATSGMMAEIAGFTQAGGLYTSVTVQVKSSPSSLAGILGTILNVQAVGAGVVVHLSASLPTQ